MDEETRKAFARVHLGICAIEGMVASLLLNDAAQDGDEARIEEIKGMVNQIQKVSEYFSDALEKGEAE